MDINITNYLRINPVDMILVLISTALIVLIAKKYFWNIAKNYLDQRQAIIAEELKDAAAKKEESEQLQKEASDMMEDLRKRSKEILSEAETSAKKEAAAIVSSARETAEAIRLKNQQELEQEKRRTMNQMKEEMSDIVATYYIPLHFKVNGISIQSSYSEIFQSLIY